MPSKYHCLTHRLTLLLTTLFLAGCQLAPVGLEAIATGSIEPTIRSSTEGSLTGDAGTPLEQDDLWLRIRRGPTLTPDTLYADVLKQRDWYLRNPKYLAAVFARARRQR